MTIKRALKQMKKDGCVCVGCQHCLVREIIDNKQRILAHCVIRKFEREVYVREADTVVGVVTACSFADEHHNKPRKGKSIMEVLHGEPRN